MDDLVAEGEISQVELLRLEGFAKKVVVGILGPRCSWKSRSISSRGFELPMTIV
jgi:hypothetical protein